MALTQNGTVKFFSVDKSGNAESVQSQAFVVDSAPPTTTATPAGGAYNAPQSVALACDDGTGSGCAATHYTTDGSEPTTSSPTYTTAISITATTTLKFFSVDKLGISEPVHTETYTLETDAPTTTATPAGGLYNTHQSVVLSCNDGTGSGCAATHYTTDGSTPTTSSPVYSAALSLTANTTLKFFSVDQAGNAEAVHTETYNIDTAAPITTATPAGGLFNVSQSVVLSCNDGTGSGCTATHYTLDGSTPTTSSPTYSAALSITTTTTVKFFSVDQAGNSEAVRTETYNIDTVAPTTTATPAGGLYNAHQSVVLACTDGSGSGCAATHYTLDGSTPTTSSPVYSAALSLTANTTLKFFSVDRAGNAEAVHTETYNIDTAAPTTTATPAGGLFNAHQSVVLACTDGSGSGCAATHYTLDGSTPTTSSPVYSAALSLAANTTVKFFSVDRAGNAGAIHTETYEIDTAAPTTTATPAGGLFNASQSVVLACTDGSGSGCAATHYTLDGSTPTTSSPTYSAALSLTANTTVKFFSVDRAGNAEAIHTETYEIDTAAPTTTATPAGGLFNAHQSVVLACTDGSGSGCAATHYTLDGSTPTTSSPVYSAALSLTANTTVKFFSVDTAGNTEAIHTETYEIDTAAPTTTATPAAGTYGGSQSVVLACNDGTGSGCTATYYTTDGSTPTTSSPVYSAALSITADTTVQFFSVDTAGNAEAVQVAAYVIDTSAPSVSAAPLGGTYRTTQSVVLSCTDGSSGNSCSAIYYTTDGSTPSASSATYSSPISVTANITLKFYAVDSVGNASSVRTETYTIDTVAPTSSAIPFGGSYGGTQSVTLLCTDGSGTGCTATHFTVDGSTPTRSSSKYTAPLTIAANTTLKFFSVDAAGNDESVHTETYVIDTVKPTVAAAPAGGLYTTAQNVTLTCTDNASGSGCASIHYTLDGSAPTTGSATYTAPIAISADTTLKFLAVDKVGNVSTTHTEVYDFDTVAPTTSATPAGGTYRTAQSVTLACTDDTGGSGCANTYYTRDGSTPTTGSTRYTAAISISANTTLKFFSVDVAGNAEAVKTVTYVIDTVAPTTTATPKGGTYASAQSVTLACSDSNTGCAATYYTLDGSEPTTGSTRYTAAIAISATTSLRFFSVDVAGNAEAVKPETYNFINPADISANIAAIRSQPDGTINHPVPYALVTYTKPLTGTAANDPAGFFIQGEQNGPAVFVAVDPATLTPVPAAGDRVTLIATERATSGGMVRVTKIDTASFTVHSTGESVDFLRNDVSNVDLATNGGADYESELITLTGTVSSVFAAASTGNVSANIVTLGNTANSNGLKLRITTAVQDELDVVQNCSVTTSAPMWRFVNATNNQAQPSAWATSDLTIHSCPAPKVTSATATSSTSVVVNFDRHVDPASVLANGSQFTITNGLVASAATVTGRQVQLTTSTQVGGTGYTVTVASSVKDTAGGGVDAAANNANFNGYRVPARLLINEMNPNISGGKDLIELLVVQAGIVENMTLVADGTSTPLATLPNITVAAGDIIVVHLTPAAGDLSETTGKAQYPATYNYDTAWDVVGSATGLGAASNRVIRMKDAAGNTQDAVPFVAPGQTTTQYPGQLQAIQAEGLWLPANCGGAPCTYTTAPTAVEVGVIWSGLASSTTGKSMQRLAGGVDTNQASDWSSSSASSSFGLPNP
ncbi:chitobiase/beta-hexosaminidase C-terminal domain-containing protein [Archangium lansingense]|uniref:chitobiase/beta-hexosaminidase C-terminal domain-containing protein n=1 Tax=Archangium lansingense TaxID=2995310 RepID=UPI003B8049A7